MSKDILIIFPQSTHPVIGGSQVRVNHLIRHFCEDLEWNVDYFAPQGMLRPESWGPNMDYLRAIYIPRECSAPKPPPNERIFRLTNLKAALKGGIIHALYMDLKAMLRKVRERFARPPKPPLKGFEILSYTNPKGQVKTTLTHHPSPVSARLNQFIAPHLRESLKELIAKNHYDIIIVGYVWMSKLIEWIFDQPERPLVMCDTIDVQYIRESRLENFRDGYEFDFDAEKALELTYLAKYDTILTITDVDGDELRRALPGKEVCTLKIEAPVSQCLRLGAEAYRNRCERTHRYDLIFVGANNEANQYAVEMLLDDIVPALAKRRPNLSVGLAGQICVNEIVKAKAIHPAVDVRGYVDSIEEFYQEGRIMAAPIPAGGGVKLKVIEGMAAGLPVITTPLGAEGIDFESGKHGFIVDSVEEFVEKTLFLLENPKELEAFSFAAQKSISETLGRDIVYKEFDRIVADSPRIRTDAIPE